MYNQEPEGTVSAFKLYNMVIPQPIIGPKPCLQAQEAILVARRTLPRPHRGAKTKPKHHPFCIWLELKLKLLYVTRGVGFLG